MPTFNQAVMRNYGGGGGGSRSEEDFKLRSLLAALAALERITQIPEEYAEKERAAERHEWRGEAQEREKRRLRMAIDRLGMERGRYTEGLREADITRQAETAVGEASQKTDDPEKKIEYLKEQNLPPRVLAQALPMVYRGMPDETTINVGEMEKSIDDEFYPQEQAVEGMPEGEEKEQAKAELNERRFSTEILKLRSLPKTEELLGKVRSGKMGFEEFQDRMEVLVETRFKNRFKGDLYRQSREKVKTVSPAAFMQVVNDVFLDTPEQEDPESPEYKKRVLEEIVESNNPEYLFLPFMWNKKGKLKTSEIDKFNESSVLAQIVSGENVPRKLEELHSVLGMFSPSKDYIPYTKTSKGYVYDPYAVGGEEDKQRASLQGDDKVLYGPMDARLLLQKGILGKQDYDVPLKEKERTAQFTPANPRMVALMGALESVIEDKNIDVSSIGKENLPALAKYLEKAGDKPELLDFSKRYFENLDIPKSERPEYYHGEYSWFNLMDNPHYRTKITPTLIGLRKALMQHEKELGRQSKKKVPWLLRKLLNLERQQKGAAGTTSGYGSRGTYGH